MTERFFVVPALFAIALVFPALSDKADDVDKTRAESGMETTETESDPSLIEEEEEKTDMSKVTYQEHPAITDGIFDIHVISDMGIVELGQPFSGLKYDEMLLSPGQKTVGHGENLDCTVKNTGKEERMAKDCPVISYTAYAPFAIDNGLDSSSPRSEIEDFYGTKSSRIKITDGITGKFLYDGETCTGIEVTK